MDEKPKQVYIDPQDELDFKRARNFLTASNVMAPISLLFGGIVLSIAALVLAALGARTMKEIEGRYAAYIDPRASYSGVSKYSIGFAIFAVVLNAIALALFLPVASDLIFSGQLAGSQTAPSGTNLTWG
jgi:ABC-type transport system involved in cytochrome c biogenesis permease subunit